MKMINYILIPFFLILSSFNKIQQSEGDYIIWSKDRKLQWKDFQGVSNKQEVDLGFDATTCADRHITIGIRDFIVVDIYTIFIFSRSWKTENVNLLLLNHEQRHFDIFEIFSREYRQEISNYNLMNIDSTNMIFQRLSNKYSKLTSLMSQNYDKETEHSKNRQIQELWNKKIDSMLLNLDAYSSPRIIIKRNQNNNSNKDVPKNTKSNSPFQSVFK